MAPRTTMSNTPTTPQRGSQSARGMPTPLSSRGVPRGVPSTPQSARKPATSSKRSLTSAGGYSSTADAADFAIPTTPGNTGRKKTSSGENIVVAVRVRNFLERELAANERLAIRMKEGTTELTYHRGKLPFSFDHCFWSIPEEFGDFGTPFQGQQDVYETLGVPVVDNAMKGFNSSIIAYGQTGSGKSYSVFGPPGATEETEGLIPRVCKELFSRIRKDAAANEGGSSKSFMVKASMIEIYREQVHDLLNRREPLTIKGDLQRGFHVAGMTKEVVKSYRDVERLLHAGEAKKTFAATAMNDRSSRAHTIFELELMTFISSAKGGRRTTVAKLTLCDLAGSERCKEAKTVGKELDEACNINMSLMCLGRCVETVVKRGMSTKIVTEFRESALTKLLKDSIGGNSKTVILTTISPSESDAHTTSNALRFADRAKCIKTHAVINDDCSGLNMNRKKILKQQYEQKKEDIEREKRDLERQYQLEQRQAELADEQMRLEAEQAQLESEKALLERQKKEMARRGELDEADRKHLEHREAELTKKLMAVQRQHDDVQGNFAQLEMQMYAETQNARREKEELENEVALLSARIEMISKSFDDEKMLWMEEREQWSQNHMKEIEKLRSTHRQIVDEKDEEFRKKVEKMMAVVKDKHEECLAKEKKASQRESEWAEWKRAIASEAGNKTSTIEQLQDELEKARGHVEEGDFRIEHVYRELGDAKLRISQLEDQLREGVSILQREVAGTGASPTVAMSTDVAELASALAASRKDLLTERDTAVANLALQTQKNARLVQKHETSLQQEKERIDLITRDLKKAQEEDRRKFEAMREELQRQLDAEKENTYAAVSATQSKMERHLSSVLAKHVEDMTESAAQHKAALDNAHKCHKDATEALKTLHAQEIEELRVRLSGAERARENFLAEKDDMDRITRQEKEHQEKLEEDLRSRVDDVRHENTTLKHELSGMKARMRELQADIDQKARTVEHLRATQATTEKRLTTAQSQLEESKTVERSVRQSTAQQTDRFEKELRAKKAELEDYRRESKRQIENLTGERGRLVEQNLSMRHELQIKEESIAEMRREAKVHVERAEEEKQAETLKMQTLQATFVTKIDTLQTRVADLEGEAATAGTKLSDEKARRRKAEKEKSEATAKLQQLLGTFAMIEAEAKTAQNRSTLSSESSGSDATEEPMSSSPQQSRYSDRSSIEASPGQRIGAHDGYF